MLKSEFFVKACKAGRYGKFTWCISAFALTEQNLDRIKGPTVADYDIFHDDSGYYSTFGGEMFRIEDAVAGEPLLMFEEAFLAQPGDIPNLTEPVITTFGTLLANWVLMVNPFGEKVPYFNANFNKFSHSDLLVSRLVEDPKPGEERDPDKLYMDEYYRLSKGRDYFRSFSQLCVWGLTKKATLPPPGLAEKKQELFAKYAGRLDDLTVIAAISEELGKFDDASIAGDKCERFLLGKKARRVVRSKKFLMLGADAGFQENAVKGTLIQNSLYEGWDIQYFPEMNDTLRSGSFSRGAQTALGGVSVKWLMRSASNLRISKKDCGSVVGSVFPVYAHDHHKLVGMTLLNDDDTFEYIENKEHSGTYIGKTIRQRSASFCDSDHTDYCETCLGKRLSISKLGLGAGVSATGSGFMGMAMGAMHGKQLATSRLDIRTTIR